MISRYALYSIAELSNRFSITAGLPKGVKPHYNISPTISAPVIVNEQGTPTITFMNWGLLAKGAKDTNSVFRYKTYNIPSEGVLSRHSWDTAVRERRCLVPADGFYQLNGSGKKQAFYTTLKDSSLFAFAGVYNSWEDANGEVQNTYSIITTGSDDALPGVSGRLPNIISREDEARWLDPTITDAGSLYDMLRPAPVDMFETFEVSSAVHSPKPNQAGLIERI
jgi:putative SOS response-associated peptidase YedK